MDILRKMFKSNEEDKEASVNAKDEFRKPQWFEESETDDELFDDDRKFAFEIFTNPLELQKHFERQMQQVLDAISEQDENDVRVEKNLKEEFLKPGFEENILEKFEKHKKGLLDSDLDGEIYADELHSLMQRMPSGDNQPTILPPNSRNAFKKSNRKLTDEETILGRIHGTLVDEQASPRLPSVRPDIMKPMSPLLPRDGSPFGGVFEGTYQGPKMFSQSIMTKTIRKPDGTYETTKVTQDSQGNKTTTVTRTVNGKTETVTKYDGNQIGAGPGTSGSTTVTSDGSIGDDPKTYSDRNIYVTKQGYAVPRNLW